jgi:hypothetical protein
MKTYLQMDGDQLVEYVEKREYDLLAQERADFGALVDKLERELNAAKELIREIRDNEVNAVDEATKFLRDYPINEHNK